MPSAGDVGIGQKKSIYWDGRRTNDADEGIMYYVLVREKWFWASWRLFEKVGKWISVPILTLYDESWEIRFREWWWLHQIFLTRRKCEGQSSLQASDKNLFWLHKVQIISLYVLSLNLTLFFLLQLFCNNSWCSAARSVREFLSCLLWM